MLVPQVLMLFFGGTSLFPILSFPKPFFLTFNFFKAPLFSSALLCQCSMDYLNPHTYTTIHYDSFIHIKHTLGLPTQTEEDFTNNNPLLCSSLPAKNQAPQKMLIFQPSNPPAIWCHSVNWRNSGSSGGMPVKSSLVFQSVRAKRVTIQEVLHCKKLSDTVHLLFFSIILSDCRSVQPIHCNRQQWCFTECFTTTLGSPLPFSLEVVNLALRVFVRMQTF